jgi:hypothetical protein
MSYLGCMRHVVWVKRLELDCQISSGLLHAECLQRCEPFMCACPQVDAAWRYLEKTRELEPTAEEPVYEVRARRSDASVSGRGIFLREPLDGEASVTCTVDVRPVVHAVR